MVGSKTTYNSSAGKIMWKYVILPYRGRVWEYQLFEQSKFLGLFKSFFWVIFLETFFGAIIKGYFFGVFLGAIDMGYFGGPFLVAIFGGHLLG